MQNHHYLYHSPSPHLNPPLSWPPCLTPICISRLFFLPTLTPRPGLCDVYFAELTRGGPYWLLSQDCPVAIILSKPPIIGSQSSLVLLKKSQLVKWWYCLQYMYNSDGRSTSALQAWFPRFTTRGKWHVIVDLSHPSG